MMCLQGSRNAKADTWIRVRIHGASLTPYTRPVLVDSLATNSGQLRPFHQVAVESLHERAPAERAVRAVFGEILLNPPSEARPAQKIAAAAVDGDTLERSDLVIANRTRVACLYGAGPR